MKRTTHLALMLALTGVLLGCTAQDAPSPDAEQPAEAAEPADTVETTEPEESMEADAVADPYSEAGSRTNLSPVSVGPYTIKPLHIGDVSLGHFNLYVEGGEPAAVRAWVGDENATNVVVTLAEFEVDHHCAHLEVPQPLPEGAKLWVEVETADGERMKNSTDL